jgi:site-specific recombinase XerD
MNKVTNFSKHLTDFMSRFLPGEKGASVNTIASYKDTFILFLTFMRDARGVQAERLTLENIDRVAVVEFLDWIETDRHCAVVTRNVRLAAIHSFFKYLQYVCPEGMAKWHAVLAIPVKKTEKPTINYLTLDGIKLLLAQPDQSTKRGRRDLALLSLLYDSAARVSEIINITPAMVRLDTPCTVKLIGKGNKARVVPLLDEQMRILRLYMQEQELLYPHANMYPLFFNCYSSN